MSVFTREPLRIPPSPRLTACTIGGVGRLIITISALDATSSAETTAFAPLIDERLHRGRAGIEYAERVPGVEQPRGHRAAHATHAYESNHLT